MMSPLRAPLPIIPPTLCGHSEPSDGYPERARAPALNR